MGDVSSPRKLLLGAGKTHPSSYSNSIEIELGLRDREFGSLFHFHLDAEKLPQPSHRRYHEFPLKVSSRYKGERNHKRTEKRAICIEKDVGEERAKKKR